MGYNDLDRDQLEALSEFRSSEAWKVINSWHHDEVSSLQVAALSLDDVYVEVVVSGQKHIKKISIADQLKELQGRINQINNERAFVNKAVKRYNEMTEKKKKKKK